MQILLIKNNIKYESSWILILKVNFMLDSLWLLWTGILYMNPLNIANKMSIILEFLWLLWVKKILHIMDGNWHGHFWYLNSEKEKSEP